MRNEYEEKQAAKAARLRELAEKAERESVQAHKSFRAIADHIPLGQPILIGHHSEAGHRADLRRMDRHIERSAQEQAKAAHYKRRAESVGKGGISSDDPEAVQKLRAKLEQMESHRENIKRLNAAWRKAKTHEARRAVWDELKPQEQTGLLQNWGFERHDVSTEDLTQAPATLFPQYVLPNLGGNIRRVRERIEELSQRADAVTGDGEPQVMHEGDGFTVTECPTDNRYRIEFPGRPARTVTAHLRANGWKWSRDAMAWQRQITANARASALCMIEQLPALLED